MSNREIPSKPNHVCLGVVATAHGIKGEVRLKSFTEYPEDIAAYGALVNIHGKPYELKNIRVTNKGVVANVEGILNRNMAENIAGTYLFIHEDNLPEVDENEVYFEDVVGMKVIREDGSEFGTVSHIFETGANDVLSVNPANVGEEIEEGKKVPKEVFIPFTEDAILQIDHENKLLVVSSMADEMLKL